MSTPTPTATTVNAEQAALYEKIRAILRKAESSTFEAEANTFFAKAQELMLRYRIDEEELWRRDPHKRTTIEQVYIAISDKDAGSMFRRLILRTVAELSSCRMYYKSNQGTSVVVGFSNDLIWVEMLFSSIIVQANFKMAHAQAMAQANDPRLNSRTFRNNFWEGFQESICFRLHDTYRQAQREVNLAQSPSQEAGSAIALQDRKAKVDAWVNANLSLGRGKAVRGSSTYNEGAQKSGKFAAGTTDISGGRASVARTNTPRATGPKALGK